jgi:hypothetical protein
VSSITPQSFPFSTKIYDQSSISEVQIILTIATSNQTIMENCPKNLMFMASDYLLVFLMKQASVDLCTVFCSRSSLGTVGSSALTSDVFLIKQYLRRPASNSAFLLLQMKQT